MKTFDGRHVTADRNSNGQLISRTQHISLREIFEIESASEPYSEIPDRPVHYGDSIALKATDSENFVSCRLDSNGELKLNVPWVREWEKFILIYPSKPTKHGKTVRYGDS